MTEAGVSAPRRIRYLDGLRGVAILMVVLWHYLGPTYASFLPTGERLSGTPVIGQGWTGVHLFFLISGFVIFLTLERCTSTIQFLVRRWLRLTPALLIVAPILFAISYLLDGQLPGGERHIAQVVPTFTFISPSILHAAFGVDVPLLDGAYWTLVTEFAFYASAAPLYFLFGWRGAVKGLVALWLVTLILTTHPIESLGRAPEPLAWIGVRYFGWFAAGALYLKAAESESNGLFGTATAVALASALTDPVAASLGDRVALLGVALLFAGAQRSASVRQLLAWRPLFFVGTVSYPLYLLHNDLGVGMIAALRTPMGSLASAAWLPVLAAILLAAFLIHRFIEPVVSAMLKRLVARAQRSGTAISGRTYS